ncbi:glycosyltransferase family 4 protein [Marilutibacter chinensis]|uniref:Glycosyltransferase family 4 protein n=1 Tax=Marilutibacter chinensis TaxID=2912247 RepID=A0ABS9HS38_9GAMM|nr:glycosyltransferase family 4 protein [Lysobacter chinensis]MCF7220937.1 glycosyltransferase family 4 protein [Lysobacter chinensis]
MPPERILIVTDEMEVGGSQRQIVHLLAGLDRQRWQPELLFFRSPSRLVDEVRRQGIEVHQLRKRGRVDPLFLLAYAALLRRRRFALVHAFSLTAELWSTIAATIAMSPRRRPALVASVRGLYLDASHTFWRIKRFIALRSCAVVANAQACADAAAAGTGVERRRFEVVPNGILVAPPLDDSARERTERGIGRPPGRPFALFVGRLVEVKNLPCLIRALARLPREQRPWLALAGDGPMRPRLAQQVAAAGLKADVRFLGERDDAVALMQIADMLVLPSWQEGMSNAVMEAMAAGCPVVASAVGGNVELIDPERTGLLFASDDDAELALCLQRLGGHPSLRQRLAGAARERMLATHSIARMIAGTGRIYERCIRQVRPAPAGEGAARAAAKGDA